MEKLYLEDLSVGFGFTTGTLTVTEAEIKEFAGRYDPQPFHLDDAAARQTLFGGLAASGWHTAAVTKRVLGQGGAAPAPSGWHTAAMTMRLRVQGGAPLAWGIIGGGGKIAWPRPTRAGDV